MIGHWQVGSSEKTGPGPCSSYFFNSLVICAAHDPPDSSASHGAVEIVTAERTNVESLMFFCIKIFCFQLPGFCEIP